MLRPTDDPEGALVADICECARVSVEAGDKVATASWGGVDTEAPRTTATYIKSIGGLLCWAAGNDGRELTVNHRDADDLIVVGGTNPDDGAYQSSAWGVYVDLAGPAVGVYTTGADHDAHYLGMGGTSLAAPVVAGLAALLWSAYPSLTPDQVEAFLKAGCEDVGLPGIDDQFGYGRINVYRSLLAAEAVYVDFDHTGFEFGTWWWPYNTFTEGYAATPAGGVMVIKDGVTTETPSITQPMSIFATGGTVTIGN
jgi:subtilisin family serine protease